VSIAAYEPAIAAKVRAASAVTHDQLTGLFQAGIAARQWPPDTDPALQARLFIAGLYGLMAQWHTAPGSFSLETAMAALAGTGPAGPSGDGGQFRSERSRPMSQTPATSGALPVRASDAERDQAAEILRAAYAEGRLSRAELDERLTAVSAAKTRTDLHGQTSDLPGAVAPPAARDRPAAAAPPFADPEPGTGMQLNVCRLLCLLFACPPAGIAYWILTAGRIRRMATAAAEAAPGVLAVITHRNAPRLAELLVQQGGGDKERHCTGLRPAEVSR